MKRQQFGNHRIIKCILSGYLAVTIYLMAMTMPIYAKESTSQSQMVAEKEEIVVPHLYDNREWYEGKVDDSVITMYLTVSTGNKADGTDHTWKEVNSYSTEYYRDLGIDRYKVEGLLQIDDTGEGITENSFGYGEEVPNVSVQVRGQTSSKSLMKNYKIRIKSGKGLYQEQRTLNLNKHSSDPYGFLNKLSYDLLDTVPQLIGSRTQFVHLYVADKTSGGQGEYEDYGLYTMVEQINRRFLRNHGLDENGQLYKVTFFEWRTYDAVMIPSDDPDFDVDDFEKYMEIKGDSDTTKIREVIEKLQNYRIPIKEIIDEHFDAENLCYWMAFQGMIDNTDVGARNLFIYSPLNSEKFYMISWDMDASFRSEYREYRGRPEGESWCQGMTQYLGLILMQRMLKEPEYREMLGEAVEDIHDHYVNKQIVDRRVAMYAPITKPYLYRLPDINHKKIDEDLYDTMITTLGDEAEAQYQIYQDSFHWPWPFFVGVPELNDKKDKLVLSWGTSYETAGENVKYSYILARDYNFEDVISQDDDLLIPGAEVDLLPPGTYFLRVTATNESGYSMDCFDYLSVHGFGKVYGCYCFIVDKDGTIKINEGGFAQEDDE